MNKLIRHGKKDLLSQLHEDFDRLISPFDWHRELAWPATALADWMPSIDVKEEETRYVIQADVPGVKAEDIHVTMENGILSIRGERELETKEEKKDYLRVERSSGSFIRQMTLPETIDQDHIQAKCKDGVLEVILPKAKQKGGRKIEVKGE